jgi:hypothetical protein
MTPVNLTRVAALALMLAPALVAVAHADDEYGTGHEAVVRQVAGSAMLPMTAMPQPIAAERFAAGQNDNFGAPQRDALIRQSATRGSSAVLVDVAQAKTAGGEYAADGGYRLTDLVGSGGRQDELAREIYQPGSATDF